MISNIPKQLSEQLGTGEKLLWFGRPDPFRYAVQGIWPYVIFSLLLASLSLPKFFDAETEPKLSSIWVWGISLIPLVLVLTAIPIKTLWQFIEARKLVFFITDTRAGKLFSFPRHRVWSLPTKDFRPFEKQQLSGGLGSIFFGAKVISDSDGTSHRKQGFVGVSDINEVERILSAATATTN